METRNIDQEVKELHEKLKAEYYSQMSSWRFFRELEDFAKNMIVLEMIDRYHDGKRSGWMEQFSKRLSA